MQIDPNELSHVTGGTQGAIYNPTQYDPRCEPNHFGGGNGVYNALDQWSWPSYGYGTATPPQSLPIVDQTNPTGLLNGTGHP